MINISVTSDSLRRAARRPKRSWTESSPLVFLHDNTTPKITMGSTYVERLEDTQRDLVSYFDKSAAIVRSNFDRCVTLHINYVVRQTHILIWKVWETSRKAGHCIFHCILWRASLHDHVPCNIFLRQLSAHYRFPVRSFNFLIICWPWGLLQRLFAFCHCFNHFWDLCLGIHHNRARRRHSRYVARNN